MRTRHVFALGVFAAIPMMGAACGSDSDQYKATPAFSGRKANLPAVPTLPATPIKQGDAFTVYGAIHHLNSLTHAADVTAKDIAIVGYIVDTNLKICAQDIPKGSTSTIPPKGCAPPCAIHKTGKADPDGCISEIPTLVLADTKGDASAPWKIRVMGFNSNFANIFEAVNKYKGMKDPPGEKDAYKDVLWAVDFPYPLTAMVPGAKVKITGKYGVNFQKASSGIESDPRNGVMTFGKIDVLEEGPDKLSMDIPKK